ncbi:hypothetical protein Tco_1486008, partial [Tanacetum coccineum]
DDEIDWWIDSGATCHACKDRCWFDTFHLVEDGSVLHMADESTKPILGRGNVVIESSYGKTITLFNVVYVLGLRKNLMSGPMLNKCGYKQVYESDKFYVIEPNDFVSLKSVIESRDAIFDKNRFSSIPRPKDIVSSSNGTQGGDLPGGTPIKIPEPRRSNRARVAKSYGSDFQLYLVEGSRDEIAS